MKNRKIPGEWSAARATIVLIILLIIGALAVIVATGMSDRAVKEGIIVDKGYNAPYDYVVYETILYGDDYLKLPRVMTADGWHYIDVYNEKLDRTRRVKVSEYWYAKYQIGETWYEDISRRTGSGNQ